MLRSKGGTLTQPSGERGTPRDPEAMKEAHLHGVPVAGIAQNAGLSYSWTRRKMLKTGVRIRKRKPRDLPIPEEKIVALYRDEGKSIQAIAESHPDLYYKRVRNVLLANNVTLRPSTRAVKPQPGSSK